MALISRDGIVQEKTGIPLYLHSAKDIDIEYGASGKISVKRPDGDPLIEIGENDIFSSVLGTLKATTLFLPQDAILNTDYTYDPPPDYGGMSIKRLINSAAQASVVTDIDSATGKIISSALDPIVTADKLIYLTSTRYNDGLYEVASIASNEVTIKTSGVANGVRTSLVDESGISAILSVGNPAYTFWDETTDSWEFGYFDSSFVRHNFKAVGLHGTVADDFSVSNPNIGAVGGSAAGSGAKQVGVNNSGFSNISGTDVQTCIGELDSSFGTPGTPVFDFAEVAANGSLQSYARTDATIALFLNAVPAQLLAGASANKGTSGKASRHDHIHDIPTAVPVSIGTANLEGSSTHFARADHVHKFDTAGGDMIKSGVVALADAEDEKVVTYATGFPNHTNEIKIQLLNTTDVDPYFFESIITAKDKDGFTVKFSGQVEGSNYSFMYIANGD